MLELNKFVTLLNKKIMKDKKASEAEHPEPCDSLLLHSGHV